MKVRFILYDDETLISRDDMKVSMIEREETYFPYTLLEAEVKAISDIKIQTGGGKYITPLKWVDMKEYIIITNWDYSLL